MSTIHWDDSHHELHQFAQEWVARELTPFTEQWEESGQFPIALHRAAGEAGLLGVDYPEEFGGMGGDIFHSLIVTEALIRSGSSGTAVGLGSHVISTPPIMALGTQEQKERFIPPIVSGEKIAALAASEPDAGSDVARFRTTAKRDGDVYLINGAKTYITSGCRADWVTLIARTGPHPHKGLSMFVVERDSPGYTVGRSLKKMGWWASDTAELFFEDCPVPVENRIGNEGDGFKGLMANFMKERLFLSGHCLAIAQLAYDESLRYAKERRAFEQALTGFQVIRHKLVDMATKVSMVRAFTYSVAEKFKRGEDIGTEVAMLKNIATQACCEVADEAVQIHGGMGYMRETLVERLYRDARLYPIGGGTTEIMKELISKRILK